MNQKGQFQVIGIFFQVVIGILFWSTGIADEITYWTQSAIATNNLSGLVAFLLAYMNLWIFLGFMLMVSIGGSLLEQQ